MSSQPWEGWAAAALEVTPEELKRLGVAAAAELLVSRALEAGRRGAAHPMVAASGKRAGGNSRIATRRMLDQLRFRPDKRRAVHRLLAGTSTWPGLFAIWGEGGRELTPSERRYVRRHVRIIQRATAPVPGES
jgi:hypothetical protein